MAVQVRNKRDATERLASHLIGALRARTAHEWYNEITAETTHATAAEVGRVEEAMADLERRLQKLAGK